MSPTWNESLTYGGRTECEVLPQARPITPSTTSASENVSSTDEEMCASRTRRTAVTYSTHPKANISGVLNTTATSGSIPVARQIVYVRNAARIRNAPCAMLITRMTPKISVRPDASSAYVPPISRPRTTVWTSSVTRRDDASLGARLPARHDLVGRRRLLGQHDLRRAVLPLADEELALRAAVLVPAQRAEDRVDRVAAQPVGELELIVDRADALDRRLHHLRRGVRVRGVLGHLGAAEHLL